MAAELFFGNLERLQMLPGAISELPANMTGFSEDLNYVNGGADVVRSHAGSRTFDVTWMGDPNEVNPYKHYWQGYYGDGLLYMQDPMAERYNLCLPNWASPKLIEVGDWKNVYKEEPVFSDTASNTYNQPTRTATWTITGTANEVPEQTQVIIIPPGKTLHFGASGSSTGTAKLRIQPINLNGSLASVVDATLLSATASTRMNASFSGATYKAIRVYFTRTSTASSTLVITSMMSQLWDTGTSPTLTGDHIPGEGTGGMKFSGPINETYYHAYGPGSEQKGVSMKLVEVESWV